MDKKIVVITGSPRKIGNSFAMTDAFIQAAEAKGHSVIRFDAAAMNVGVCHACETCYKTGKACSFDDDFNTIAPAVLEADAVVFTGGVGEYSVPMRKRIMNGITALGIKLDDKRNEACSGSEGIISTDDSSFKAIVMPTNEELMIAMSTVDTLGLKK